MASIPQIIVQTSYRDRPKAHEMTAALIVAQYFKTDIIFLRPSCQKTPDFKIGNQKWELKSPIGNSKNTMKNNLHAARPQSKNIILDLRRCKMHQNKSMSQISFYFKSHKSQIKNLLIITKSGKIIDFLNSPW